MKLIVLIGILLSALTVSLCSAAGAGGAMMPDIGVPGISDSDEIPDWVVRWELARCLSILKRYDEAVKDYRLLLEEKPGLEKARLEMAQALLWDNRESEVAAAIKDIKPERLDIEGRIILADIYMALKEYALAQPLYRSALKARPDDHRVRLKLAEMLSWEKKYSESLAEYRILLDALPEDIQIRRKYAMVLIWSGEHGKAVTELRRTLR